MFMSNTVGLVHLIVAPVVELREPPLHFQAYLTKLGVLPSLVVVKALQVADN